MALHYAGIQCEIREVDLKHKPQALLEISPKATVPVLLLPDDRIIDESLDIMFWVLSEKNTEYWLAPSGGSLNDMVALIRLNDSEFKHHLDRYKYPQRFDAGEASEHFRQACQFLSRLELRLEQSSAFLFGHAVSVADVALFPFVRQFAAVDRLAFEALPMPYVQQWLSGWEDNERFQSIMLKRQTWQPGDEVSLLLL